MHFNNQSQGFKKYQVFFKNLSILKTVYFKKYQVFFKNLSILKTEYFKKYHVFFKNLSILKNIKTFKNQILKIA